MAAALQAGEVRKRYRRTEALRGVDLEVGEGELVGLLGPNGAGKSTLTKIACGLVRATEGSVAVAGHPAGSATARAEIGYLAELFRFPAWASRRRSSAHLACSCSTSRRARWTRLVAESCVSSSPTFEALYQSGLHALTSSTSGLTGFFLKLGPFGGAEPAGPGLVVWAAAYCAAVLGRSASSPAATSRRGR